MKQYFVSVACCLVNIISYCTRLNINIAILEMVKKNDSTFTLAPYNESNFNSITNRPNQIPTYDWDKMTQQTLLGAFYYGYTVMQIPGGILAVKLGGKCIITFVIISMSLISALSPWAASVHVGLLITLRILDGVIKSMMIPAVFTLLSKWANVGERSVMVSIVFAGKAFGGVIASYTTGLICSSYKIGGWPMSFYIYSMFGAVLAILWITFVSESPAEQDEYISNTPNKNKSRAIPLYDIFTSKPVWAIAVARFSTTFAFNFFLIEVPTFFSNMFGVNVNKIGLLTSLPSFIAAVTGLLSAAVADYIIQQKYLSILKTRHLFLVLGVVLSVVGFIPLVVTGYNVLAVEILYIVFFAASGFNSASVLPNAMDITDEYAGFVAAATQTFASCTGIIIPIVTGLLIKEQNSLERWTVLFSLTGGINLLGMVYFIMFSEAEQQVWSEQKNNEDERIGLINK
ncbi:sialin-like isoform X1 [Antedon mediterranea]|uniref:sialin-like isoform X1 n=2 Tax=Antedon mediterranea TaxID=105859 RepID=UPI003AF89ED4